METIQEAGEIFVFANIESRAAQFISNGWPVTINGAGLEFPFLKEVHEEIRHWLYRGWPEVHLIRETPLCKNGPLCLVDRSGWSSLRSLNSCCHCLRETLLLDCSGSRSQAWRLRLGRFLWGIWLKGRVRRLGRQAQWDLAGQFH